MLVITMKKRIILGTMLLILLMSTTALASGEYVDKYEAPDGIEVISHTSQWQGNDLIAIYQELMSNAHGKEISHLDSIQLHGGESPNGEEEGLYSYTLKKRDLLSHSSVSLQKGSVIHLYNMDQKKTVEEVARVLSHEYGHHFTLFYLAENDEAFFLDWTKSRFYKVRQGELYPKMNDLPETEHRWMIAEICAEDYVQLYGSILAKKPVRVYDISERLRLGLLNQPMNYSSQSYNMVPQENREIPLALDVEAATGYWTSLTGIDPALESYSRPELTLGERKQVSDGHYSQILQWSPSVNSQGEEATVYTLVAAKSGTNEFLPIKSLNTEEPKQALIGTVLDTSGPGSRLYTDSFAHQLGAQGYDDVRVIALGSKGEAVSSESYTLDFLNGTLKKSSETGTPQPPPEPVDPGDEGRTDTWVDVLDFILDRLFTLFELLLNRQTT
jgi:hypothetical protein